MTTTATLGGGKGYRGMGMEGPVARWYEKVVRRDLEEVRRLARSLADGLAPDAAVLEVAPGPGFLAIELAKLGGGRRVVGLDISRSFVEMAAANAREAGVSVDFRLGDASAMPFEPGSFDRIVCRAAFKNFTRPGAAIDEMHRVLRPGGRAVIIDLRRDARPDEIAAYVDGLGLGRFDALATRWIFRHMLIKRAYTAEQFRAMAAASRFGGCTIELSGTGMVVTLSRY